MRIFSPYLVCPHADAPRRDSLQAAPIMTKPLFDLLSSPRAVARSITSLHLNTSNTCAYIVGNARCLHIARLQRLVKKSSGSSRDFGSSSSRQLVTFDAFSTEKHVTLFLDRCTCGAARSLSGRSPETLFQQRSRMAPDDTSQTLAEPNQTK